MKNWKQYGILCFIAFIVLTFVACDDNKNNDDPNKPKDQSATIILFGGASSATIKGYMTNAQWEGVADKIAGRLNNKFNNDLNEAQKSAYIDVFARGVTYIVEVNPEGYSDFKTIGDGKTVYIALSAVDTTYVVDAVVSMYNNASTVANIKKQNDNA